MVDVGNTCKLLHEFMSCRCQTQTNVAQKGRFGASHWANIHLKHVLLSQEEQNNKIFLHLGTNHVQDVDPFTFTPKGFINGMHLCWQRCMPFLYGVSKATLVRLKSRFQS